MPAIAALLPRAFYFRLESRKSLLRKEQELQPQHHYGGSRGLQPPESEPTRGGL